ncbi:MAG: biotin/lipoyl-binding carrier protein [Nitrospirae bacterium]|nr:biotin/lipoyl-binding carrier protein [Nitrospirota bacterium]
MATEVTAHITGNVWKIEKKTGDAVSEGDVLIILESMKMEIPIEAPASGTLKEIKVKETQNVIEGQVVALIE